MVLVGFAVEFVQMMRPGQSCHPPIFDLFWRIGSFAFGVMFLGAAISIIGILADARRGYAVTALVLFLPLLLLIVGASGCG
jgi:hypothetical protein